ncbi:hypothetical protein TruAng_008984 [Truncatella angustata]|nr:hypothetical protein TruAng_008984 [Truncatella angustata]
MSTQRKVLARANIRAIGTSHRRQSPELSSGASVPRYISIASSSSAPTPISDPHGIQAFSFEEEPQLQETTFSASKGVGRVAYEERSIPTSLSFSWEVRARSAFFSYYIFGFSRSHDALTNLYTASSATSVLSAAVDAAALAFLAKHHQVPGYVPINPAPGSSELIRLTSSSYITAIKLMSAIVDTALAPQVGAFSGKRNGAAFEDATFQAVLLLDLCEKLACVTLRPDGKRISHDHTNNSNSSGNRPWLSHLRGALDLVRVRGLKGRYSSSTARRLTARLVMTLVISCGVSGVHVPQELEELRMGLLPYLSTPPLSEDPGNSSIWNKDEAKVEPKFAVTSLVVGVVNLAADVQQGSLPPGDLIRRSNELDNGFVDLESELPSSWQFERKFSESGFPVVYAGYYDIYTDHFVTQVRNVIRSMRLLLFELMWKRCPDQKNVDDYQTEISEVVDGLCGDICAAVPQFVWLQARSENCVPFTPLQLLQCYTLLSPLYIAGKLSTHVTMRAWIISTLHYMADSGGLMAAKSVAEILETHDDVSYWQVYAMLGSYAFAA